MSFLGASLGEEQTQTLKRRKSRDQRLEPRLSREVTSDECLEALGREFTRVPFSVKVCSCLYIVQTDCCKAQVLLL